jgi:hypothetical protein
MKYMLKYKAILILSAVCILNINLFSQQLRSYQGAYTLNSNSTGTASYSYYSIAEDSIVLHGRFAFSSDILQFDNNNIRQINTSGTYRRGKKHGEWIYERNDYNVNYKRITGVNIESTLDGTINRLIARFNDGLAAGKWSLTAQQVSDSKRRPNFASSSVNFNSGKASGKFTFTDPTRQFPLKVDGQFDNNGYFDGIWKLSYEFNGVKYEEEREYASGFLLNLLLSNTETGEVVYDEKFEDIRTKIDYLAQNQNDVNYKMGDRPFGLLFNDGYRQDDLKIIAQENGNKILHDVFDFYLDSLGVLMTLPGFVNPVIGNTRRFQYVYPENEQELLEVLRPMVNKMETEYDSIINTSVLRINQQKNDTLAFYYKLLDLALEKSKLIHEVIDEIQTGKFDYQFRDNFYSHGIVGLNGIDTVWYEYQNKKSFSLIEINNGITTPDSLVYNLYKYTISLDAYINRFYDKVSATILSLQQEEKIAKLDEALLNTLDTFLLTYVGSTKLSANATDEELQKIKKLNDLQLAIFKRYTRDVIRIKMQDYIELESFDKKYVKGNSMIDLLKTLIDIYPKLERITSLSDELDQVFTRYSPNPFFERDIVTRIKQGIYSRGVELLLPYQIEMLKKSSSRAELLEGVEAIFKLDSKMRELANSDDQETNRLNSRIRRESQPERIKRLLGL